MKIARLLALATLMAGSALAQSVIQFGSATATANEAGPNVTVTVTRTGSTTAAQSVTYMTGTGTAVAPGDFVQTTGMIAFAAGETSKTIAIGPTVVPAPYVRIMNDTLVEGPETFTLTLSRPAGGAVLGTPSAMTVTIVSDENGVSMATATMPNVAETAGTIAVLANRSGSTGAVSVNYACVGGTAVLNTHFQCVNGTLDWADGESGPKSVLVNILDNPDVNVSHSFNVTLAGASGATLVAPMATAVTIVDNDNKVQFSAPTATVTEGTANLMLSVTRTGVITQPADVTWATADGTALAGTDFGVAGVTTPSTGTLHWNAGVGTTQTITLPILNDNLLEGAKTFTVNLSAPVGANLSLGTNTATVTLNDNDKGVQFQNGTYEIFENAVPATLTVQVARVGPANMAITATWATVNGTAESGKDFGILNNLAPRTGTLSWGINDVAPKAIMIPILQDAISEGDETFTITLTPGAGVVLGTPGVATVTLHDDDIPPESAFTFAQPKYVVTEGAGNVMLTINRVPTAGDLSRAVSVKYSTTPGTALATTDYATATNLPVSFAAFEASRTISIQIANNAVAEQPKTFKVALSGASPGASIGAQPDSIVLILDDDEAFPRAGVMPPGFSTPAAATAGWAVSNDPGAYEGAYSLKTQEIDDGQSSGLQMSGTFAAGTVRFYVKVSTEPGYDVLQFFIDDVLQTSWSGTTVTTWQLSPTYTLGAGVHTLKWVYTKDGSVSMGSDMVWLDGLATPTFTP